MEKEIRDLLIRYYELSENPGIHKKTLGYLMQPHEAIFLYGLIMREEPSIIFESGTAVGWSATWMALASDAAVFTYDPVVRERLFSPKEKDFIFVHAPFSEVKSKLDNKQFQFKRLYLIDGDHSLGGFLEDLGTIIPYLNPEDIIVLHDTIREQGVCKGLVKIKKQYPNWKYESIETYNGMEVITVK